MKNLLNSFNEERLKINLLFAYVLFLPLSDWSPIKINSIILMALGVIWLYQCFKKQLDKEYYISKDFLLPTGVFFIQLLSIYHDGLAAAVEFNLLVKLPFLILPLVFTNPLFAADIIQKMQRLFVFGCMGACIVSFRFLFKSETVYSDLLNYEHFEAYLVLHRPYFGMYLLIAIVFLIQHLRHQFQFKSLILAAFFVFFILYIQAKMSLIILAILLLVEGWHIKRHLVKKVILTFSLICLSLMAALLFRFYITNAQQVDSLAGKERFYVLSINTRLIHFQCGFEIVKQHPFLGVGAGNIARLLDECYQTTSPYFSQFKGKYNAHNEFLEETARHGLVGLSVYLICYFFYFKRAIQSQDKVYFQILLIVVLASLTESVYSRSQGVMLISFFNFLYFVKNSKRSLVAV